MISGGLIVNGKSVVKTREVDHVEDANLEQSTPAKGKQFSHAPKTLPKSEAWRSGGMFKAGSNVTPDAYANDMLSRRDLTQLSADFRADSLKLMDGQEIRTGTRRWSKANWVSVFEKLIESDPSILSDRRFREGMSRDQNLLVNQFIREANSNIAYKRVDFEITDGMTDDEFWARIDNSDYSDLIENNAATAIFKMLQKTGTLEDADKIAIP